MAEHWGVGGLRWRLREILQTLWVRVAAFAALGLVTAATGSLMGPFIPDGLALQIGAEAIEAILEIIASSMLTVTTFSLSILTAAYATASSGSTPRAVQLLVRDGVSQTVLATFMGAFVFSLVGLIMLKTELYGGGGRVVLFVVTLLVIAVIILSLLRWINRLGELGLIGDNLARVEQVTLDALQTRLESPWMGANPLRGPPPADSVAIMAPEVGHVQNLDMQSLSDLADKAGVILYLTAAPGDMVHPAQALCHVQGMPTDPKAAHALRRDLIACINLRPARSFAQDPRFGFVVLTEIGQRALSPAVNDPGTAIAVITRMLRILSVWTHEVAPEVRFPRLHVRSITAEDLLRDSLMPLARDGAAMVEVHRAVQNMLLALTRMAPSVFESAASELSRSVQFYAGQVIVLPREIEELDRMSNQVLAASEKVVPSKPRDNRQMNKSSLS
ncbi:DUF2254 domain-containing protein [Paracoccus liaowanqingii]|uniref:DUF2254 domain-containing protein n=1 Tax=Paracoccus liaowanqingii TaxID=2560053 RepID=A0A4P7HNV5_9RHOB|nr:DUF2254 domain-containing protein [Paracoccus liaowanqingii]QBX35383.1 DUF2254 domain-containing protein [Paracoccus liaowanqingii]